MMKLRFRWLCAVVSLALPALAADVASRSSPRVIPDGTTFLIRLDDKLDTAKLEPGKHFKAKLAEDLVSADGVTLSRGKKVKGHVSSIDRGLHARMLLSFDEIQTDHGWMPLIATVTGVPGEHGVKAPDSEGDIERKGMSKTRMAEAAAVGAGIGATSGAIAGGGHGAAIGAGVGAGAGTMAGILTDRELKLDKGTILEVRLDHPLQLPSH